MVGDAPRRCGVLSRSVKEEGQARRWPPPSFPRPLDGEVGRARQTRRPLRDARPIRLHRHPYHGPHAQQDSWQPSTAPLSRARRPSTSPPGAMDDPVPFPVSASLSLSSPTPSPSTSTPSSAASPRHRRSTLPAFPCGASRHPSRHWRGRHPRGASSVAAALRRSTAASVVAVPTTVRPSPPPTARPRRCWRATPARCVPPPSTSTPAVAPGLRSSRRAASVGCLRTPRRHPGPRRPSAATAQRRAGPHAAIDAAHVGRGRPRALAKGLPDRRGVGGRPAAAPRATGSCSPRRG